MNIQFSSVAQSCPTLCDPVDYTAMTNLGSILKNRDITLPTKVHLVKAMLFPVVTYDVRVGL